MAPTPDEIRIAALASIERNERMYRWAFAIGVSVEFAFCALFLILMNLHDRLQLLLFIATVSSYTIVVMGLIALGALSNRNAQRILRAIADNRNA
jgi:Kef-type K+ transport system membrane component KefB